MEGKRIKGRDRLPRGYRMSRTLDTRNAPQTYHYAPIAGDQTAVKRELWDGVLGDTPMGSPFGVELRAKTQAILERIQNCEAIDPDDVQNISSDRRLWEARIELIDSRTRRSVRLYHAEPERFQNHLIALHAARKYRSHTERSTKDAQNRAIACAKDRLELGDDSDWGLRPTPKPERP